MPVAGCEACVFLKTEKQHAYKRLRSVHNHYRFNYCVYMFLEKFLFIYMCMIFKKNPVYRGVG